MKKAHSNIFGMTVDAGEVNHKDCETYQIVCRECREYVFKTVRQHGDGAIHYFSHYRVDPDANALCEERAKTRLKNGESGESSEEREQTLQHYLACFTNMLDSLPYFEETEVADARRRVNAAKGVDQLRRFVREGFKIMPELEEMIRQAAYGTPGEDEGIFGRWEGDGSGWIPVTQFARSMQVRIATDMLKTLLTKPAIPAWNALYSSAWLMAYSTGAQNDPNGAYGHYTRIVVPVLGAAIEGQDIRRQLGQLAQMRCSLPYMVNPGTWHDKLQVEIMEWLLSLLLSIDYARWSAERLAGTEPQQISADLRAKAIRDFESQKKALIAAGININPLSDEELTRKEAEHMAGLGNHETQINAAIHRGMTGEGREFRHAVEAPANDAEAVGMMLLVRPKRIGRDVSGINSAIHRQWPGCVTIDLSQTGVPNTKLNWKGSYATLVERLHGITANENVEEATAFVTVGLQAYAITSTKQGDIVEKIGKPLAA